MKKLRSSNGKSLLLGGRFQNSRESLFASGEKALLEGDSWEEGGAEDVGVGFWAHSRDRQREPLYQVPLLMGVDSWTPLLDGCDDLFSID